MLLIFISLINYIINSSYIFSFDEQPISIAETNLFRIKFIQFEYEEQRAQNTINVEILTKGGVYLSGADTNFDLERREFLTTFAVLKDTLNSLLFVAHSMNNYIEGQIKIALWAEGLQIDPITIQIKKLLQIPVTVIQRPQNLNEGNLLNIQCLNVDISSFKYFIFEPQFVLVFNQTKPNWLEIEHKNNQFCFTMDFLMNGKEGEDSIFIQVVEKQSGLKSQIFDLQSKNQGLGMFKFGLLFALIILGVFLCFVWVKNKKKKNNSINKDSIWSQSENNQKTEEGIKKYNELLRTKMLNGKKDQSEILKGIALEEQCFQMNLSFSFNSRSIIAFTKDLSLEEQNQNQNQVQDQNQSIEECPSFQLSVIDKNDQRKYYNAKQE